MPPHIGHGSVCSLSSYFTPDNDLGTDYPLKGAREEGKTGQEEWDRLVRDKEARRALLRKLNKQGLERGCPHGCLREECSKQEKSSCHRYVTVDSTLLGIRDIVPLWYVCQQHKSNLKQQKAMINSMV